MMGIKEINGIMADAVFQKRWPRHPLDRNLNSYRQMVSEQTAAQQALQDNGYEIAPTIKKVAAEQGAELKDDLMENYLEQRISNFGYPVGMGMAPNPDVLKSMAKAIRKIVAEQPSPIETDEK